MYIKSLSYTDKSNGWSVEHIDFKRLSLLVGLSGAGKTRILKALMTLQNIINDFKLPLAGVAGCYTWQIVFLDDKENEITWSGERTFTQEKNYYFNNEEIIINGENIASRSDENKIIFNNQETIKLSQEQSLAYLFREENLISTIFAAFKNIWVFGDSFDILKMKEIENKVYDTIEQLQLDTLSITQKFCLAYKDFPTVFNKIVDEYKEIFPFVENIIFSQRIAENYSDSFVVLSIKETSSENRISSWDISSGMGKSLYFLASLYLSPPKSVFLIDELENSFGLNCLSPIIEKIMLTENMQFILTSHHPYIINNINSKDWIYVKRNGSSIVTKEVDSELSQISTQDKFIQLTNLLQDDNDED